MEKTFQPLISVVIPVYNLEGYIDKCLDSVTCQTYGNLQVVLVNDGSTDKSEEIISRCTRRDPRIELINKNNQGVSLARRDGIAASRGEFIFFLDGDDYISCDCIEKLYEAAERDNSDIVVPVIIRETSTYSSLIPGAGPGRYTGQEFLKNLLRHHTYGMVMSRLYRRDLFDGISYHKELFLWEDFVMNVEIAVRRPLVTFIDDPLYHYVKRRSSANHSRVNWDYITRFMQTIDDIFAKYPDVAAECRDEIRLDKLFWFVTYIKRSSNPWVGDSEYARKIYDMVVKDKKFFRRNAGAVQVAMVRIYDRKCLKPLVGILATCQRLFQSFRRRGRQRYKPGVR